MRATKKGLIKWMAPMAGVLMLSVPLWAADYSSYSTDELAAMRGTLQNATVEERNAFRAEWQKRMQQMSPEERTQYMGPPKNAPRSGYGAGNGQGKGYGKGSGKGYGMGAGAGNGYGHGGCKRK